MARGSPPGRPGARGPPGRSRLLSRSRASADPETLTVNPVSHLVTATRTLMARTATMAQVLWAVAAAGGADRRLRAAQRVAVPAEVNSAARPPRHPRSAIPRGRPPCSPKQLTPQHQRSRLPTGWATAPQNWVIGTFRSAPGCAQVLRIVGAQIAFSRDRQSRSVTIAGCTRRARSAVRYAADSASLWRSGVPEPDIRYALQRWSAPRVFGDPRRAGF
jgi:hypothetical protein